MDLDIAVMFGNIEREISMGIEGNFRQIAPSLLEIAKQDLYVLNLYLRAKQTSEMGEMQYLLIYLRDKGFHGDLDAIIADDLWRIGRLDIDSDWHAMHYLLTEDLSSGEVCWCILAVSIVLTLNGKIYQLNSRLTGLRALSS